MRRTPNLDRLIDPMDVTISDGWVILLEEMAKEMTTLSPNVRLSQVKSKFGGLRVYLAPSEFPTPWDVAAGMAKIISKYESLCAKACEKCGQSGAQQTAFRGWVQTLCAVHEVMGR